MYNKKNSYNNKRNNFKKIEITEITDNNNNNNNLLFSDNFLSKSNEKKKEQKPRSSDYGLSERKRAIWLIRHCQQMITYQ